MSKTPGIITLMGSGELTSTMVEVHKDLLNRYGDDAKAAFIDTPAGFQLNADHISRKATEYFAQRVKRPLTIASLKSSDSSNALAIEQSYQILRQADYIFIGPGSPTYALNQWRRTRIPDLIVRRIQEGGCLVAASAAALTVGRLTLPVYEIYKVGHAPHWVEGLNILHTFGFNWAVIPHWNNAEGGNHDTRYCFMGAPRFHLLEDQVPETASILGLDEHTALIIDLADQRALIKGMGQVTLRKHGRERIFEKGDEIPLALLRGEIDDGLTRRPARSAAEDTPPTPDPSKENVWQPVEALGEQIQTYMAENRIDQATHALLDLERHIREAYEHLQECNAEGAAVEVLRNMIALFGTRLAERPAGRQMCLEPLVSPLLELRALFREQKQWQAADAVRGCLHEAGIVVEDSSGGVHWYLEE